MSHQPESNYNPYTGQHQQPQQPYQQQQYPPQQQQQYPPQQQQQELTPYPQYQQQPQQYQQQPQQYQQPQQVVDEKDPQPPQYAQQPQQQYVQPQQQQPQQPHYVQPQQQQTVPYQEQPTATIQQQQQQIVVPYQEQPTNPNTTVDQLIQAVLHNPSTQSSNTQLYPKSGQLYNEMIEKFGMNNIQPIPDYLTNDKVRIKWLKRDGNALLYFIHRKDKYQKELQQMVDNGVCGYKDIKKMKNSDYVPFGFCCESCLCCCCAWQQLRHLRRIFNANMKEVSWESTCFPICCGGIKFRQSVIKRLQKSGIQFEESECQTCMNLCWCHWCTHTQTSNLLYYAYYKRYGVSRRYVELQEEYGKDSSAYSTYMNHLVTIPDHPYATAEIAHVLDLPDGWSKLRASKRVNERERTLYFSSGNNKLFHEWYKTASVVELHNKYWKGYHAINMGDFRQ